MATKVVYPAKEQNALVPRQEVLPAVPPLTERQIIDHAVTAPPARGIFGLIEQMRRDHRAIVAERNLMDALRERQAAHIQARYEAQLELDLGQIVEEVRHQLTVIQLSNLRLEMDLAAQLTVEASRNRVQQWVNYGSWLKSCNVMSAEQVDRMVLQYITMEVSATITHLATMGGIDGVRRTAQTGGTHP